MLVIVIQMVGDQKVLPLVLLSQHQLKQKVVVEEEATLVPLAVLVDLVVVDADMRAVDLEVQQMQLLMAYHQLFRVLLVVMVVLLVVEVEVVPVRLVLPVQEILVDLVVMEYQIPSELAQVYSMAAVVVEPVTAWVLVMEETVEEVMETPQEVMELLTPEVVPVADILPAPLSLVVLELL